MRLRSVQAAAFGRLHPGSWSPLRRAILATLLLSVAALSLAWNARATVVLAAARAWIVSDRVAPADVVVILGGGLHFRPYEAAELYRNGLSHRIIYDLDEDRDALLRLGVPAQNTEKFGTEPRNTYEESCALQQWARKNAVHRIIIPTEVFSSRREKWIFARQFANTGVDIMIDAPPVPPPESGAERLSAAQLGQFRIELVKYAFYRVRYLFAHC